MGAEQSDLDLVTRAQQGDLSAFDLLVRRYQSRVTKMIAHYLGNDDDALDVVQEAFIKAYRAIDNFRGDSAFYTWIYRIAINTAKNFLKKRSRQPLGLMGDLEEEQYIVDRQIQQSDTPENILLAEEVRQLVDRTIGELPEDLRMAIMLRELDGLSYEEIASVMECPIGTVRSRLFRARAVIDEALQGKVMAKELSQ